MTKDVERFLTHVEKSGPAIPGMNLQCWRWTGATDRKGRPRFKFGGRGILAKRAFFEMLVGGRLPYGYVVGSLCRNKKCVRPEHLVPCNNIDAAALGQWGTMDPGMMCHLRRLRTEGYTVEELAVMREVSVPLIQAILREGGLAD